MHTASAILLFVLYFVSVNAQPCTEDDLQYMYTSCENSAVRYLISYYPSTCTVSTPPPPIQTLDCSLTCPAGHFLAPPYTDCQPCPAGQHAVNTVTFDSWSYWPENWFTDCQFTKPTANSTKRQQCEPWQLSGDGSGIYSKQHSTVHNLRSSVTYRPRVINYPEPGAKASFSFSYLVSSEYSYDGLEVWVDGSKAELGGAQRKTYLISGTSQADYRTVTVPLSQTGANSAGIHEIKFVYVKDEDTSAGDDTVQIKDITISGTRRYASSCIICEPGTFSRDSGSEKCEKCPENHWSYDPNGATDCEPCPEGQWAPAGASDCRPRPECRPHDFYPTYGPCDKTQKRNVTYRLINDICTGGTTSESMPSTVQCAPCAGGSFWNSKHGKCEFCGDGMASGTTEANCTKCEAGFVAIKEWLITDFAQLVEFQPNVEDILLDTDSDEDYDTMQDAGKGTAAEWIINGWESISVPPSDTSDEDNDGEWAMALRSSRTQTASSVMINTKLYTSGSLYLKWEMVPNEDTTRQVFTVQVITSEKHFYHDFDSTEDFELGGLHAGDISIVLEYHRDDSGTSGGKPDSKIALQQRPRPKPRGPAPKQPKIDYVVLHQLILKGSELGGAVQCEPCPAGHRCPALSAAPIPCQVGFHSSAAEQSKCEECPANSASYTAGTTECTTCGEGTTPNSDKSSCTTDCSYEFTDADTNRAQEFDLSALQSAVFGSIITDPPSNTMLTPYDFTDETTLADLLHNADMRSERLYFVQLCNPITKTELLCPDDEIPVNGSYVCTRKTLASSWSLGKLVKSVSPVKATGSNFYDGLLMSFHKGDDYQQQDEEHAEQWLGGGEGYGAEDTEDDEDTPAIDCNGNTDIGTEVLLKCSPDVVELSDHKMQLVTDGFVRECVFRFEMKTAYACPKCTDNDYVITVEPCVNGSSRHQYVAKKPCVGVPTDEVKSCVNCQQADYKKVLEDCVNGKQKVRWITSIDCQNPPEGPPKEEMVDCVTCQRETDYQAVLTPCIDGKQTKSWIVKDGTSCWENGTNRQVEIVDCTVEQGGLPPLVVAGIIAVIVAVALLSVGVCWWRYRQLHVKYSALAEGQLQQPSEP